MPRLSARLSDQVLDLALLPLRIFGSSVSGFDFPPCPSRRAWRGYRVPMAIVSLLDVSLSFGGAPLLDRVNLQIERGERVCLVGRNGAGKSTLMKVIAGEMQPDTGQVTRSPADAVIATLRQEVPVGLSGTVQTIIEGTGGSYEEHNDWER